MGHVPDGPDKPVKSPLPLIGICSSNPQQCMGGWVDETTRIFPVHLSIPTIQQQPIKLDRAPRCRLLRAATDVALAATRGRGGELQSIPRVDAGSQVADAAIAADAERMEGEQAPPSRLDDVEAAEAQAAPPLISACAARLFPARYAAHQ